MDGVGTGRKAAVESDMGDMFHVEHLLGVRVDLDGARGFVGESAAGSASVSRW